MQKSNEHLEKIRHCKSLQLFVKLLYSQQSPIACYVERPSGTRVSSYFIQMRILQFAGRF